MLNSAQNTLTLNDLNTVTLFLEVISSLRLHLHKDMDSFLLASHELLSFPQLMAKICCKVYESSRTSLGGTLHWEYQNRTSEQGRWRARRAPKRTANGAIFAPWGRNWLSQTKPCTHWYCITVASDFAMEKPLQKNHKTFQPSAA